MSQARENDNPNSDVTQVVNLREAERLENVRRKNIDPLKKCLVCKDILKSKYSSKADLLAHAENMDEQELPSVLIQMKVDPTGCCNKGA